MMHCVVYITLNLTQSDLYLQPGNCLEPGVNWNLQIVHPLLLSISSIRLLIMPLPIMTWFLVCFYCWDSLHFCERVNSCWLSRAIVSFPKPRVSLHWKWQRQGSEMQQLSQLHLMMNSHWWHWQNALHYERNNNWLRFHFGRLLPRISGVSLGITCNASI